jgi:hypothetical protein
MEKSESQETGELPLNNGWWYVGRKWFGFGGLMCSMESMVGDNGWIG